MPCPSQPLCVRLRSLSVCLLCCVVWLDEARRVFDQLLMVRVVRCVCDAVSLTQTLNVIAHGSAMRTRQMVRPSYSFCSPGYLLQCVLTVACVCAIMYAQVEQAQTYDLPPSLNAAAGDAAAAAESDGAGFQVPFLCLFFVPFLCRCCVLVCILAWC